MQIIANRPPAAVAGAGMAPTAAGWLLRLAVAGFCAGAAVTLFGKLGSGIGTYFFLEHTVAHATVAYYERLTAWLLLALGVAALIRPHWAYLLPLAVLIGLEAWARRFNGGAPFAEWTPYAYALRALAPIALALLFSREIHALLGARRTLITTGWTLRVGLAVIFCIHGIEAFLGHPRFIDYLIGTSWNLLGVELSEANTRLIMQGIGVVDVAAALAVIVKPARPVLYWMAFWGLITALSRVTTFGLGMHFEVLLRFSHFLAPLALVYLIGAARSLAPAREEEDPSRCGRSHDRATKTTAGLLFGTGREA
jgi:hypothetical protein